MLPAPRGALPRIDPATCGTPQPDGAVAVRDASGRGAISRHPKLLVLCAPECGSGSTRGGACGYRQGLVGRCLVAVISAVSAGELGGGRTVATGAWRGSSTTGCSRTRGARLWPAGALCGDRERAGAGMSQLDPARVGVGTTRHWAVCARLAVELARGRRGLAEGLARARRDWRRSCLRTRSYQPPPVLPLMMRARSSASSSSPRLV